MPSPWTHLTRRECLKLAAAGVVPGLAAGWFRELASQASAQEGRAARAKSCILLWMAGGPSQTDTFDMKPGTPQAGEFRPSATRVPGIQICEHLPRLARHTDKLAILRGMSTGEADHHRGSYLMQTGYRQVPGTYHPHIGSIASAEVGRPDFELPNFFWLGGRSVADSGFLGARHGLVHIPQIHDSLTRNLENVRAHGPVPAFDARANLLDRLEQRFNDQYHGAENLGNHRETYQQALRMMRSPKLSAFEVSREPEHVRASYGPSQFGRACLLARRLVEVGVPFVGIGLGDFDTHNDNWSRLRPLLEVVDQAMSALLADLEVRGLLNETLVIWMGEFGRDPFINNAGARAGREHYASAWTSVLAGAGLRTGQVVGRTSADGRTIADRPVSTGDFMATICRVMGIDYTKENTTPEGRPIRIAATGARPVGDVF
jgi:uncharacterized protein (DUF1501 family)